MKIGTKVNLILVIVFLAGLLISGTALANVLGQKAENEVSEKALVLMQVSSSIRKYTNERVHPLLLPKLDTQEQFIPESIPAFSVREVFEIFRKNKDYANFLYKDATLKPTNLRDKADDFETRLVKQFQKNANLTALSGYRTMSGEKLFYTAKPLKIVDATCLNCHSTPDRAPKSQIVTYGSTNGFGWNLNEIVAAQVIYVPAANVLQNATRFFVLIIGVIAVIFSAIVFVMNLLLRKTVLQRIKKIATVAEKVSVGDMDASFGKQQKDEIGALAEAFNRMKYSLEIALNMLSSNSNIQK